MRTRSRCIVRAGLGESFRKFSDSLSFENWAPRSSRAWRLGIDIHKEKAQAGESRSKIAEASSAVQNFDLSFTIGPVLMQMQHRDSGLRHPSMRIRSRLSIRELAELSP